MTRIDSPTPDEIARAAENTDAAEQDDGDDIELEAGRHVAAHRAEPGGIEEPGQRRDHAGGGEQRHLHPLDPDARIAGRLEIVADDIDEPAERRAVQDDRDDDEEDDEDRRWRW